MTANKSAVATRFQFGITKSSPCSYLANQVEELLVVIGDEQLSEEKLSLLQTNGFRRSGDQIYRPYCRNCDACISIRVPIASFRARRSQKRLIKRNSGFHWKIKPAIDKTFYPLYTRYISQIHKDSSMYPPNEDQFDQFVQSSIITQHYLCIYDKEKLISVAVTDVYEQSLSAVYTFYDPDYRKHALGIYSVLCQIEYGQLLAKQFLYLGYQINQCPKMNYKMQFRPHQLLLENSWILVN